MAGKTTKKKKAKRTTKLKTSGGGTDTAATGLAVDEIPIAGKSQDSWAWHPDSVVRGQNFLQVHANDAGQADHKALIRLSAWLFAQDQAGELPNLGSFQQRLHEFDPTSDDAATTMNKGLAGDMPNPAQLSHAQWVQLWHVLIQQEDVRLVAPRQLQTLTW